MRRRLHLKKRIRIFNKKDYIILIIIFLAFFVYSSLKTINKKVVPILIDYAEIEVNRLSSIIIGKIISNEINDSINLKDMFIITHDKNGKIKTIDYDSKIVNNILVVAVTTIRTNLKYLSEGKIDKITSDNVIQELYEKYDKKKLEKGIFYEVPFGVIFNNPYLSNLGPKVPVKFNLISDLSSNLNTKITNYGINNAIIETSLNIKVNILIALPIFSKKTEVGMSIPIVVKLIEGEIPNYYLNGYNQSSSILTLPVE